MSPGGYEYYEILLVHVDGIIIVPYLGDKVAKKSATFIISRKVVRFCLRSTYRQTRRIFRLRTEVRYEKLHQGTTSVILSKLLRARFLSIVSVMFSSLISGTHCRSN